MTRTTSSVTGPHTPGLATQLRTATDGEHRSAENAPFIQELLAGELPIVAYTRLVTQHHALYTELERAVAANIDPDVALFLAPELERLPALQADLTFLAGSGGQQPVGVVPATVAYCAHLAKVCDEWPGGLLAHHYVRYLGDLSGGQLIRRVLVRTYGFTDERGTEFYRFPRIASPKAFKERYRAMLDALPWGDVDRQHLIDEVARAYQFNRAIFVDLGTT